MTLFTLFIFLLGMLIGAVLGKLSERRRLSRVLKRHQNATWIDLS